MDIVCFRTYFTLMMTIIGVFSIPYINWYFCTLAFMVDLMMIFKYYKLNRPDLYIHHLIVVSGCIQGIVYEYPKQLMYRALTAECISIMNSFRKKYPIMVILWRTGSVIIVRMPLWYGYRNHNTISLVAKTMLIYDSYVLYKCYNAMNKQIKNL